MAERIIVFDTTLRDGEQSPGASMNKAEKLRLARQLEKLKVDVIEAGFPVASQGDFEAVALIAKEVRGLTVTALSRTEKTDIDRAWEAVKEGANPRLHIFIATSDLHLKYKLKKSRKEVLEIINKSVSYASRYTSNIEFSAEDGSRTDPNFLVQAVRAAVKAGATTINIPDTVGYALPEELGERIRFVREQVEADDRVVWSVHCHNDLGLAVANSLSAIQNGARQVEVTINGIGERAGNTSLEELVMALHTRKDLMPFTTGIETKQIYHTSRLVSRITGLVVPANKAVVGANAFAHESGIHQDGVLKKRTTYEIMTPKDVGLDQSVLVLGKHSGRHAFQDRLKELGYVLNPEDLKKVFERFKELADKKKEVVNEDIEALIADEILMIPDTYKLVYISVISGNMAVPTATVQIEINGEIIQKAGFGVGPIDATFNTINKIIKTCTKVCNLVSFSVNAITGGTDAQGQVTVRIQQGSKVILGKGSDSDIITASAKAYLNALNRLDYLKKNPIKSWS
ncbi:MAG TPA: 2-isopropylmalate synthase [Thermodesulfobacteriota bacterium]|nr:2-isopropylmalate synthase [Thermodesulfobacteriota bacterium]